MIENVLAILNSLDLHKKHYDDYHYWLVSASMRDHTGCGGMTTRKRVSPGL